MTYTEAIEQDEQYSMSDVYRYCARLDDTAVSDAVRAAIQHANWFPETDSALCCLAIQGESHQIRDWADEIATEMEDASHGWPQEFCDEVAALWRTVADEVDTLSTDEKEWAREWAESHSDDDELDDDELKRAFHGLYGRWPDRKDGEAGVWSLVCAAA